MPDFQRLKGFRDLLPEEMAARREVFDRIEAVLQRYGFHEIDLPALESMDLYLVKSGEELVEQTYSFEDKGGRDVTLTPEQTPSRARILANRKDLSMPVKWYSISKRWRYENPQKGRLREFYQMDIDIFGSESVQADAEIIAVAVDVFDALDVLDAVDVLINDRRVLEAVLTTHGISETEDVLQIIDDKEKMTQDEFRAALEEAGLSEEQAENVDDLTDVAGPITAMIDEVDDLVPESNEAQDAVDRLRDMVDALDGYGVAEHVKIDLSIVRGLAYYTGLVFEVFDTEGELRALCGGGRYDDLIGLFGGSGNSESSTDEANGSRSRREVPAVGFAPGDAPIEALMKREGVWPAEEVATDVYVLPVSDEVRDEALSLATELRSEGCIVETDVKDRNVGGQFDYADAINADTVIVVGKRDLANNMVTVKDMASGDEEQVPVDEVVGQVVEQ